ncbi:MAG: glycosyltransferase family 4 protein [Chloroherpetonaceae bacterium]|nr:glycosyltransferase family 4 protein [Chloroherpetonaceae bacterium]
MTKKKILLICPYLTATYIQNDLANLRKKFDIEVIDLSKVLFPKKVSIAIFAYYKILCWKPDAVWIYISIPLVSFLVIPLSKILNKKVFVITGGYEISYEPSIDWGEMKHPIQRFFQRFGLRFADAIFPYSNYSSKDVQKYSGSKNIKTIYFGVDSGYFSPSNTVRKQDLVVSVCATVADYSVRQKGVLTLIEAAKRLPDVQFVIIGKVDNSAKRVVDDKPSNMIFAGRVSDNELLRFYQKAKVYAQLSAHEGFGIANIEAMSCECLSLVTPVSALPEITSDAGLYAPFGDVDATVKAIQQALLRDDLRKKGRERVVENFQSAKRDQQLIEEVEKLLS